MRGREGIPGDGRIKVLLEVQSTRLKRFRKVSRKRSGGDIGESNSNARVPLICQKTSTKCKGRKSEQKTDHPVSGLPGTGQRCSSGNIQSERFPVRLRTLRERGVQ